MLVGAYAVSETGVLVFQGGGSGYGKSRLTWLDRTGKQIGVLGDEEDYEGVTANNSAEVSLSPDGTRATAVITGSNAQPDVWIFDVARGTRMRLTIDPAGANAPVWSPDGNTILYRSTRNQQSALYKRRADGAGAEELVPSDQFGKIPESWSPDGRYVLYYIGGPAPVATQDVWVLPMFGAQKPYPFIQSPFNDRRSQFSPDGRWVAYQSNETGRFEVYIVPFPGPGGKTQVSTEGGREPRWRRDGKELFYLAGTSLTAAAVTTAAERPAIGKATRLFELQTPRGANEVYDVAPDGRRFLVDVAAAQPNDPITVVVNWPALLKKP
jgi:Tol biopolymer transport system component